MYSLTPPAALMARSTDSEARTIARWACARARSLVVVTSRYHSRRARLILRQALAPEIRLARRAERDAPVEDARGLCGPRDGKGVGCPGG